MDQIPEKEPDVYMHIPAETEITIVLLFYKHQVGAECNAWCRQSPAGRAPTILISIVGTRPAGDSRICEEFRSIAPKFQFTATKLSFMRQQCIERSLRGSAT